jgi:hypothetical protein
MNNVQDKIPNLPTEILKAALYGAASTVGMMTVFILADSRVRKGLKEVTAKMLRKMADTVA